MRWTTREVESALGSRMGLPDLPFSAIGTDTRALAPGALFVALVGERFDAHNFLSQAKASGAQAAIVRRGTPSVPGLLLIEVDDTLQALGRLARHRRRRVPGPVVAVTGSNGKTSTKEMLARALATHYHTHATAENLNNLVGVPLTILSAPDGCESLVVECGANLVGELARQREVVEPTLGIVTNVTEAHLAGFGSLEGVLQEKVSLLDGVPMGIVGRSPPALLPRARAAAGRVLSAGLDPDADIHPTSWHLDEDACPSIEFAGVRVRVPAVGRHQGENAMLVLAAARELGLDMPAVAGALLRVTLPHGRGEVLRSGPLTLLFEAYSANPASLQAALDTIAAMRGKRPVAILLGPMLELGPQSAALHQEMADQVMALEPALVGVFGEFVPAFTRYAATLGDRLIIGTDAGALGQTVAARLRGDELILLKGSRGARMEGAIPHLMPENAVSCSTTS